MSDFVTIAKNPKLPVPADYYGLRQEAINYLQKIANGLWTDYNLHDPGISFMELVAFGITDLAYRQNLPIENLLAFDINGDINNEAQALYTPAEILTTNPWTAYDYRRLLIDIPGVKNAWLSVNPGLFTNCGEQLYIDCIKSQLVFTSTNNTLAYRGLYDVNVELDDDSSLGDLNSGSVVNVFSIKVNGAWYNGFVELRMPSWQEIMTNAAYTSFRNNSSVTSITGPSGTGSPILSGDSVDVSDVSATITTSVGMQNALSSSLYASFIVNFPNGGPITMSEVPLRVYFYDSDALNAIGQEISAASTTAAVTAVVQSIISTLAGAISDTSSAGLIGNYLKRMGNVSLVMTNVAAALQGHRNLCEDFCTITAIPSQDFSICCDIDAETEVDLAQLQAEIYYAIETYFNPPVNFYSWEELQASGLTINQIFDGPRTSNGFVKETDLENSEIRTNLYSSELIAIIAAIPGVISIRNFSIAMIDNTGTISRAEVWNMPVPSGVLPRFYTYGSKINFFKNSIPFATDFFESSDLLALLIATNESGKLANHELDVPLPQGTFMPQLSEYYPLMFSLPVVYNVSPAGPLPPFTPLRNAQARQLTGYLLLFEQLYANWAAQVGNIKDFFNAYDPTLPTYYSRYISNSDIPNVTDLYADNPNFGQYVQNITEPYQGSEFYERKNRIYNHMLARLGENNKDYLLINNSLGSSLLQPSADIVAEKADLISRYPSLSYNKARGIDYFSDHTSSLDEGLVGKLTILLGLQPLWNLGEVLSWVPSPVATPSDPWRYQLVANFPRYNPPTGLSIEFQIFKDFQEQPAGAVEEDVYAGALWAITIFLNPNSGSGVRQDTSDGHYYIMGGVTEGANFQELCRVSTQYATAALATAAFNPNPPVVPTMSSYLTNYFIQNLVLPIEHILLRPQAVTDTVFNICVNNCDFCGEEDPYSFRMTVVLSGEQGYPGYDLDYRAYAEDLIRQQVPAHILVKVCWLSQADCLHLFTVFQAYMQVRLNPLLPTNLNQLRSKLVELLNNIRSMYPPAVLHDCYDGNPVNRVLLGKTVITSRNG